MNDALSYENWCAETGYNGPADEDAYDAWTNWAEGKVNEYLADKDGAA